MGHGTTNQGWPRRTDKWFVHLGVGIGLLTLLTISVTTIAGIPAQDLVTVDIATDPPNATVQIDGQTIGQTRISTSLPEGEHDLIIFKEGFKVIDRKIYADPSAPLATNEYSFELILTGDPPSLAEKSKQIQTYKRQAEEAFKRGDYVAPELDNAWYYVNKLQELDPNDPFIEEMRERIRRTLKQQAEIDRQRNDLA